MSVQDYANSFYPYAAALINKEDATAYDVIIRQLRDAMETVVAYYAQQGWLI